MDITFELDLGQTIIARQGYNLFDFFSDIGGMQGLLFSGFAAFMGFWNYGMFDNYMSTRLYKLEQHD